MKRLKKYLEQKKITQTDFAERVGVTQSTVSDWLNGVTEPGFAVLREISRVTKLSIDELVKE